MTQIFANRAELMPPGETTEEHKKWQAEEAALLGKDRSSKGPKGGLFRGCFRRRSIIRAAPIRDDGVDRCPRCTSELEEGQCESCGYLDEGTELSESDGPGYYPDELYHMDHVDGMEDDIIDALAEAAYGRGHGPVYGEDLDSNHSQSIEDYYSPPPDRPPPFGYRFLSPDHQRMNYSSLPDTDEDSIDDEGTNSLDDFVEDDEYEEDRHPSVTSSVRSVHWDTDDGTGLVSIQSQDSDGDRNSQDETESNQNEASFRTAKCNLDEDSDEGPVPPARRQIPRISITSDESSSSEISQVMAAIRNRRQRPNSSATTSGISRHRRNIPHHSRDMGDSDSPVTSQGQRRRRPIQNHLSSDEESGNEASSGTATVGRLSPRSGPRTQKINRPQGSQTSNASSPILFELSPTRSENAENVHLAVPGSFPPSIPFYERSQSALPVTSTNRSSEIHESTSHAPTPANYGAHSSPRTSSTLNHSPALERRQRQGSHPQSPSQSRRSRHSPATRLSRSPMGAEQRHKEGVRDRRAEKLERREERRRLKAERERRQEA